MFSGSGTTLLAAKNLKRSCYSCEKDAEYFKQTNNRLNIADWVQSKGDTQWTSTQKKL